MGILESFEPIYGVAVGIIIVIFVLMRQLGQRQQMNVKKQNEREIALRVAQELERKNQMQSCCGVQQSKVVQPKTRAPLGNPLGTPFTGNIQGIAAKWEVEIHTLGRQIIGQIDTKMAALQTITLDANRTANRLEILVEHLEQIARQQMEWQQNQLMQNQREQNADEPPTEEPPTVIPTTKSVPKAAPLGNVLKELEDDLDDLHTTIKRSTVLLEQPEPATILRMPTDTPYSNHRSEVEMLANYGLEPQDIAQRLNISLGEVDLMLQVQQNRLDQTT